MNDLEKAINIGENNLDKCFGSKRDYGITCALEMAQWKDEQFEQEKEDFFDKARKFLISHGRGQLCRQFEDFVRNAKM